MCACCVDMYIHAEYLGEQYLSMAVRLRGLSLVHVYPRSPRKEQTRDVGHPTIHHCQRQPNDAVLLLSLHPFSFPHHPVSSDFLKSLALWRAPCHLLKRIISLFKTLAILWSPFLFIRRSCHRLSSIRAHMYIHTTHRRPACTCTYIQSALELRSFPLNKHEWIIFLSKKHHHQSCSMSLYCSHLRIHSFISTVQRLEGWVYVYPGNSGCSKR